MFHSIPVPTKERDLSSPLVRANPLAQSDAEAAALPPSISPLQIADIQFSLESGFDTPPCIDLVKRAARVPLPYAIRLTIVDEHGPIRPISVRLERFFEETPTMFLAVINGDIDCCADKSEEAFGVPNSDSLKHALAENCLTFWAAPDTIEIPHGAKKQGLGRMLLTVTDDEYTDHEIPITISVTPTEPCISVVAPGYPGRDIRSETNISFAEHNHDSEALVTVRNETEGDAPVLLNVVLEDSAGGTFSIGEASEEKVNCIPLLIPSGSARSFRTRFETRPELTLRRRYYGSVLIKYAFVMLGDKTLGQDFELYQYFDHVLNLTSSVGNPAARTRSIAMDSVGQEAARLHCQSDDECVCSDSEEHAEAPCALLDSFKMLLKTKSIQAKAIDEKHGSTEIHADKEKRELDEGIKALKKKDRSVDGMVEVADESGRKAEAVVTFPEGTYKMSSSQGGFKTPSPREGQEIQSTVQTYKTPSSEGDFKTPSPREGYEIQSSVGGFKTPSPIVEHQSSTSHEVYEALVQDGEQETPKVEEASELLHSDGRFEPPATEEVGHISTSRQDSDLKTVHDFGTAFVIQDSSEYSPIFATSTGTGEETESKLDWIDNENVRSKGNGNESEEIDIQEEAFPVASASCPLPVDGSEGTGNTPTSEDGSDHPGLDDALEEEVYEPSLCNRVSRINVDSSTLQLTQPTSSTENNEEAEEAEFRNENMSSSATTNTGVDHISLQEDLHREMESGSSCDTETEKNNEDKYQVESPHSPRNSINDEACEDRGGKAASRYVHRNSNDDVQEDLDDSPKTSSSDGPPGINSPDGSHTPLWHGSARSDPRTSLNYGIPMPTPRTHAAIRKATVEAAGEVTAHDVDVDKPVLQPIRQVEETVDIRQNVAQVVSKSPKTVCGAKLKMPRRIRENGIIMQSDKGTTTFPLLNASPHVVEVTITLDNESTDGDNRNDVDVAISPSYLVIGAKETANVTMERTGPGAGERMVLIRGATMEAHGSSRKTYRIPVHVEGSKIQKTEGAENFSMDRPTLTFYNPGQDEGTWSVRIRNGTKRTAKYKVWIEDDQTEKSGMQNSNDKSAFKVISASTGKVEAQSFVTVQVAFDGGEAVQHFHGKLNIKVGGQRDFMRLFGYSGGSNIHVGTTDLGHVHVRNGGKRSGFILIAGPENDTVAHDMSVKTVLLPGQEVNLEAPYGSGSIVYTGDEIARSRLCKTEEIEGGTNTASEESCLFTGTFEEEGQAAMKESYNWGDEDKFSLYYSRRLLDNHVRRYSFDVNHSDHVSLVESSQNGGNKRWSASVENGFIHIENLDVTKELVFKSDGTDPRQGMIAPLGDAMLAPFKETVEVNARGKIQTLQVSLSK